MKCGGKEKLALYSPICSEVIEVVRIFNYQNFLYVSGEKVAYNKEMLKELGIAHLINLAGDVCLNKFK